MNDESLTTLLSDLWVAARVGTLDECNEARAAIARYVNETRELLAEFVHPNDPCAYDHHGLCQAHHLDPRPCPHERAKALLGDL